MIRSMALAFAVGLIGLLGIGSTARPSEDAGSGAQKRALLIGVERYHRAPRLRFTNNDVAMIAQTLKQRGDYDEQNILEITDTALNPRFQPLRASLLAEIPAFLGKAGPADLVLVYFSGHGFRDKDGKLYLAPIDCDPGNPAPTGVSMEWFREQLAVCKAKVKLLVLDACHAGTEKGDEQKDGVAAKDLGSVMKDVAGVVTLASSTSEETSLIWEEKEQSLFSYWLNQALKGHADRDSDGMVTIDEAYDYVYRSVTQTAKNRFPRSQTPVRIVRTGTPGVPDVVRLRPQSLNQVLSDIAEQLSWAMEERRLNKVGVLEFTNDTKLGELLGADFGLLGRYCAEELERRLMDQGGAKFGVVDRRRLQAAVKACKLGLEDLASGEALRQLSQRAGGMPVIALGTLRSRAGRNVALQCKLMQTERDDLAGSAGGSAVLNESQWAMLGRSAQVRPDDRRPEIALDSASAPSMDDILIRRLDERAHAAHPLLDPNCPFPVKIFVKVPGQEMPVERKGIFRGNDMFVPLRPGEVYEVWVENRTDQMVLMRLLVDGLNTLPERPRPTKAMEVEARQRKPELMPAVRVSLDEARHWILDPKTARVAAVRGFFTSTTEVGRYNEFKVVDAQQSLAARQQFTDQIGMITAAFYAPKGGSRRIGTGLGEARTANVQEQGGTECGNLLAVVHLRYVEPEALDATSR